MTRTDVAIFAMLAALLSIGFLFYEPDMRPEKCIVAELSCTK